MLRLNRFLLNVNLYASIMLTYGPLISRFLKVGAYWSTILQKKNTDARKENKS